MFALKKKYYLIIESIKDINLENIKKHNKFVIIYRNQMNLELREELLKFRRSCKLKSINFYVANDLKLAVSLNSDGVYLSGYNKSFKALFLRNFKFNIIGSAHTKKEIFMKLHQGCKNILFSKLFLVDYDKKRSFLGIVKFNKFLKTNKNLIPLGGIRISNLNSLRNVNSDGFAIMSELKKKPAKIINRLF